MFKMNKKMEYALIALKHIQIQSELAPDRYVSAREICDLYNAPFDTMAKVMQHMNTHHILKSIKGIKGGYILAKPLKNVTYLDLMTIVEDVDLGHGPCHSHKGPCELSSHCNIKGPVNSLNKKILNFLSTLTINDLLKEEWGNSPMLSQGETECPTTPVLHL